MPDDDFMELGNSGWVVTEKGLINKDTKEVIDGRDDEEDTPASTDND